MAATDRDGCPATADPSGMCRHVELIRGEVVAEPSLSAGVVGGRRVVPAGDEVSVAMHTPTVRGWTGSLAGEQHGGRRRRIGRQPPAGESSIGTACFGRNQAA